MSFFTTTATLHHETALPPHTRFASALSVLQHHDRLLRLDPELASYEELPSPASDDEMTPKETKKTKTYKVTDHMHTLPAGLWDTTVTFECDLTNTDDGVVWVISAPLGMVQRTVWRIVRGGSEGNDENVDSRKDESQGESRLTLVEDVVIKGNRLVVAVVKKKCEENWKGIHGRFVGYLEEK